MGHNKWQFIFSYKTKYYSATFPLFSNQITMAPTTKDRLLEVERRVTRLENLLSPNTRGDSDDGLHGIHDIKMFQFEAPLNPEPDEKSILKNVSWDIRDDPSEAKDWAEDKSEPQPKVNLSKRILMVQYC